MDEERKALEKLLNSPYYKNLIEQHKIFMYSKDENLSLELRKRGNKMKAAFGHNSKLHYAIWGFFTTSIATAKEDSESLAMAYESRSALLIHLCKYEECIMDIDRALKITKNNAFKIEILCRKVDCLNALGSKENKKVLQEAKYLLRAINDIKVRTHLEDLINESKRTLNKPAKSINRKEDRKIKLLDTAGIVEMLETLRKKSVTNDFSSVDIQYNEKYGRHLIAKRDIRPGEVIYIEEPYTKCLNIKKINIYCSFCFTVSWASIPCDHCPWTIFCSEKCKKNAWEKYHHLECSVLSSAMENNKNNSFIQLAVRTLILAIKEAGSIDNLKTELTAFEKITDPTKGFVKNGKIQSMGFNSIYALAKDVSPDVLQEHETVTAKILKSLAGNTKFFGENFDAEACESYKKNENALFLGALAFRLSKISSLNHHQMCNGNYVCQKKLDRLSCWKNECCSRGIYIAPITALLNHSCDPNARRCFSYDNKVILYAIQPIIKGSQIFDCYQQEFYELDYTPRRELLSKYYNFNCNCLACQNEWPRIIHLHKPNMFEGEMNPTESQLILKYSNLVDFIADENYRYDESTIIHLGKGIDKGLKNLPQPAFTTVNLIICLNTIFERLYGINLSIPAECNYP